jgi:hypothetical protein
MNYCDNTATFTVTIRLGKRERFEGVKMRQCSYDFLYQLPPPPPNIFKSNGEYDAWGS